MSILSQLFHKQITFQQASAQAATWVSQVEGKLPADAVAALGMSLSDFKQAASNAVALADGALGPLLATAVTAVEGAADAALLSATGGAAAPLVPAVNAGIEHITAALHAAIDAKALEWKAKVSAVQMPAPAPTQQAA